MPRKQNDSFRSIQILSSKAHTLWSKARMRLQEAQRQQQTRRSEPAAKEDTRPVESIRMEISLTSVVQATLAIMAIFLAAWAIFVLHDKLIILGLAFFLAIVIDSSVVFLERLRVPRGLAVVIVYLVFLSVAAFLIISLVPVVASQLQEIARFVNNSADAFLANPKVTIPLVSDVVNAKLTRGVQVLLESLAIQDRASALLRFGQNLSLVAETSLSYAVSIAGSVVNVLVSLILILFLTFFIQMEKESIIDHLRILLPRRYRHYFDAKADAIYHKMSQWMQGQLILSISIGVIVFIALIILRMPYALTLALLAAFTEFIPYIGPMIAAVPAILIAFTQSGFLFALIIAAVYYIIQSCENNLLVPLIMKHAVGLSPIAIMFGMMVGVSFPNTIHPIVGIILAVPITTVIVIFLHDLREVIRSRR